MTIQTASLPLVYPGLLTAGSASPGSGGADTLNTTGFYTAWVGAAHEDMAISHIGFKCSSVSGSPTADVRIETVDSSGMPSGTLWATNTNAVTGTLSGTAFNMYALTATANITRGQVFAIKVALNSGTSIQTTAATNCLLSSGLPYKVTNTSGSAVKSAMVGLIIGVGSSSTSLYSLRGLFPLASIAQNAFNNTSSARRGLRFQLPFRAQCVGMRYYGGTATGDFNAAIFDDSGSELSSSSTAYDGDYSSNLNSGILDVFFDNAVTLSASTWYRAAIEPSSATNCNMYTATLTSANHRSGWPGGTNFHYTTYVASSWTDTATDQVPYIDLLLKGFEDAASSSSGGKVIGG